MSSEVPPKPSEVTDQSWLYAYRAKGEYPEPTERSGKWLIFVAPGNVDEVWAKVSRATRDGRLGHKSKAATARSTKQIAAWEGAIRNNPKDPNRRIIEVGLARARERARVRVICVNTYDWTDQDDVMHVREELRSLGIVSRISYKTDEDTRDGVYQDTVTKHRISKYSG